ncbi:MAG: PDZ domain-containing protein [Thermoanaerobaculia bacterium]|nr:PDZ domain-containing protein [Thermoanaerobaculia bacterium]
MRSSTTTRVPQSLCIGLALIMSSSVVMAGVDDEKKSENVVIETVDDVGRVKVIQIDGAGGGDQEMIFVSDDGQVQRVQGGEGHHWVSAMGDGNFVFEHGTGMHAVLGVQLVELTPELRSHFGVLEDAGVLVSKVIPESAAERAGIEVGDILTAVDGKAVSSAHAVRHNLMGREEGDIVLVDLNRNGRSMTVNAAVEVDDSPMVMQRKIEILCDDDGGGCSGPHAVAFQNECEGAEECEVQVTCGEDGCSCIVNDEAVDCPDSMPHHP